MTPTQYSETNIVNSISLILAANFLSVGYLVYWVQRDMMQTQDGFYFGWNANSATYLIDGTFAARVTAAKGIMSFVEQLPATPRIITTGLTTGGPFATDALYLPSISVEVGPATATHRFELGSNVKWRTRHLIVDGYVRDRSEQARLKDWLALWLDNDTYFTINDHDAGTQATIGPVDTSHTQVSYAIQPMNVEPTTFRVICNSILEYVA